jgi:hypothetical protein
MRSFQPPDTGRGIPVIGENRIWPDENRILYDSVGGDVDHALQADVIPDTAVPFDDGGSTNGYPVAKTGFLADNDIVPGLEVIADLDITIDDGS